MVNGGFMKMENELIKYILELTQDSDCVCEELHKNKVEEEYCANNCNNLTENCIRRLMHYRMSDK